MIKITIKSMSFLAFTACLSVSPLGIAAEFIGVTAALKGEVLRTASQNQDASIGALSSGEKIFLGDDIKVSDSGRLQVLLVDETVFTLGAGAEMTIDTFVYDSNAEKQLSANITKGAFRFVSGKIAKSKKDAMTVSVPGATIAVRGTQVAGQASEDGESEIYLLGPSGNSFGDTPGAIAVFSEFGEIEITRPGFAINVGVDGQLSDTYEATPEQINAVQADTQEGEISLTEALEGNVTSIDSDGDGIADTIQLTGIASEALIEATQTTDAVFAPELATAILGEEFASANFGYGTGAILAEGFVDNGPYAFSELSSITGSGVFTISDGVISGTCAGATCGTFNATTTWTFSTPSIVFELDAQVSDLYYKVGDSSSTLDATINFSASETLNSSTWGGAFPSYEAYWNIDVNDAGTSSVASGSSNYGTNHAAHTSEFSGDTTTVANWNGSSITTTGTGAVTDHVSISVNTGLQNLAVGADETSTPLSTMSIAIVDSSASDPLDGAFGNGAALQQ